MTAWKRFESLDLHFMFWCNYSSSLTLCEKWSLVSFFSHVMCNRYCHFNSNEAATTVSLGEILSVPLQHDCHFPLLGDVLAVLIIPECHLLFLSVRYCHFLFGIEERRHFRRIQCHDRSSLKADDNNRYVNRGSMKKRRWTNFLKRFPSILSGCHLPLQP